MTKKEAYKKFRFLVSTFEMRSLIAELGLVPYCLITPCLIKEYMKELKLQLFKEVPPFVRDYAIDFLEEFSKRSRAHTPLQIDRVFFDSDFYKDENTLF